MKRLWTLALVTGLAALASACSDTCGGHEGKTAAKPAAPAPTAAAPSPAAPGEPTAPSANKPPGWHPKSEEAYEKMKAAQPTAQVTQGTLPENFPKDLPIYPDAKPTTSMMVSGQGLVVLDSAAPVSDVLAQYRESLPAQGWTVDSVKEAAGGAKAFVKAHKEDRSTTISINTAKDGSGSEIGISLKEGS